MSNWESDGEMSSSQGPAGGGDGRSLSGTFMGTRWSVLLDPRNPRIRIDEREIHVDADGHGGFVTHEMFGRWTDLALLAQLIVRYHPDYSPLARRRDLPMV